MPNMRWKTKVNPWNMDRRQPEVLRGAVDAERKRLRDFQRTSAATEHGKNQRELGGSGGYIDAIVEQAASKRLKRYKLAKTIKPG